MVTNSSTDRRETGLEGKALDKHTLDWVERVSNSHGAPARGGALGADARRGGTPLRTQSHITEDIKTYGSTRFTCFGN